MTTFPRPAPASLRQPLRHLARRWTPSRTSVHRRRPPRHRTLAQPLALPVELWDMEQSELKAALERSWR